MCKRGPSSAPIILDPSQKERRGDNTHDPTQHLVQHRSKAPPIHLIAVRQSLDDLRSQVLGGPAKRARQVLGRPKRTLQARLAACRPRARRSSIRCRRSSVVIRAGKDTIGRASSSDTRWSAVDASFPGELLGQTKVGENDVAVGPDEDVLRLEVAVDDAGSVKPLDAFHDLGSVEASAVSAESAPSSELRSQISTRMEILQERLSCQTLLFITRKVE